MNALAHKTALGFVQPLALKRFWFGVVCLFCSSIGLLILDVDNPETWLVIPGVGVMILYHYFFTLNVANVYLTEDRIHIEHALQGCFEFTKQDFVKIKTEFFINKIQLGDYSFYFFYAPGFLQSLITANEVEHELALNNKVKSLRSQDSDLQG